jgi:hypothetical protein
LHNFAELCRQLSIEKYRLTGGPQGPPNSARLLRR